MRLRDPNLRGEWVELLFMARATEHGYQIIRPCGGHSPYDFVVDIGGGFMGVQVKSTMSELRQSRDQRPGCFSVTVRHSSRPPYKLSDFQFLAVYVIPKDVWYIIPFAEVMARKTILLRPGDPPDNGYERYREAWHLLCELPPVKSGSVKPKPYRLKSDGMPKVSAKNRGRGKGAEV